MTRTKNTIVATFATLLIGGLTMSSALAAQRWSDITYVTHGAASGEMKQQQSGRLPGDFYKWSDKGSLSKSRVGTSPKPVAQSGATNASWSDLTSTTHN
jgi:hypothetical protein